ncbi:MAG: acylphosphatase [Nanoarchaeota archaeon]|nr:acylphosphatase [Nanoarchaeota archaeon]MBU0977831.1 acylphosphatase [Nanoarchaeota archaeon]
MIFRILVKGRVQGVNFRSMTRKFCLSNLIKGSVWNLDNGDVEILAQCSEEEKDTLVLWLKSNPGFSRVWGVDVKKIKSQRDFEGFEIIRKGNFLIDRGKSAKNLVKRFGSR